MDEELKAQIARPLGQIPSGCFVMTVSHDEQRMGILSSWVQQASFEPPMVTVAVKHGRPIAELIETAGHFVLNLIGEDPVDMFKRFGHSTDLAEQAFEGLNARTDPAGLIIEDCAGYLCCRVAGHVDAGDHRVYVAEVIDGHSRPNIRPYIHLRSQGFSY